MNPGSILGSGHWIVPSMYLMQLFISNMLHMEVDQETQFFFLLFNSEEILWMLISVIFSTVGTTTSWFCTTAGPCDAIG